MLKALVFQLLESKVLSRRCFQIHSQPALPTPRDAIAGGADADDMGLGGLRRTRYKAVRVDTSVRPRVLKSTWFQLVESASLSSHWFSNGNLYRPTMRATFVPGYVPLGKAVQVDIRLTLG